MALSDRPFDRPRQLARHTPSLTWMASPWPSRLQGQDLALPLLLGGQAEADVARHLPGGDASRGRSLRDEARALLAKGTNPRVHRKQKRTAVRLADENTFEAVYRKWLKHRGLSLKEGRQTTLSILPRIFDKDVLPALGKRSIYEIKRPDLLEVIAKIEKRRALSVAEKVRTWFNQLFRYALVIVPGLEQNPASDLDVVALPLPPVNHNPFLRMAELPKLLQRLRSYRGRRQTQLGLRLLLLTGVRTGELRQAMPDQFDLDRGLWIIPPDVVKQLQLDMRKKRQQAKDIRPTSCRCRFRPWRSSGTCSMSSSRPSATCSGTTAT